MEAYDLDRLVALFGVGITTAILLSTLLFVVLYLVARVMLFKKCNQAGWKAIIPFYTDYVEKVEIEGLHWGWVLAEILIVVFSINNRLVFVFRVFLKAISFYNLAIRCKRDEKVSTIFGLLFPEIVYMVYGFSKLDYDPNIEVKESGIF